MSRSFSHACAFLPQQRLPQHGNCTADVSGLRQSFSGLSTHDEAMPELWVRGASASIPALAALVEFTSGHAAIDSFDRRKLSDFTAGDSSTLGALFTKHGSDKATHGIHVIYAHIFAELGRSRSLRTLEIGMGTNKPGLVSTMGASHTPGASLRAFRDYLPNAIVHGADVDGSILFQETRILTHQVDQLDRTSFDRLHRAFGSLRYDLVVDDGLHALGANLNTLDWAVRTLRPGGWLVVEDIADRVLPGLAVADSLLRAASHRGLEAWLVSRMSRAVHGTNIHYYVVRKRPRAR